MLLSLPALAQDASRLPELRSQQPVPYPQEALEAGLEATVLLELDISAEGEVLDARVVEPVGNGFDEAALRAARQFVFDPALDASGQPAAARIRYAYAFSADRAPPVSLEGRLRRAGTREPLGGLDLVLTGPDGQIQEAVAEEDGTFRFAGLAAGEWSVRVSGAGFRDEQATVVIREGKVAQLTLFAVVDKPWEEQGFSEVIEVVGRQVEPEITERVLSAEEIRFLPGSNGDVIKAVQNLPGVGRPPLGIGQLIIRGTAPEDSRYYLDGVSLPLVFHFAGLSTVIPSATIDELAYLPGNYGVRYGRAIGGAVDIRSIARVPERTGGSISIDLFQAALFAEVKVSDTLGFSVSGRRSYIDTVLNPVFAEVAPDFQFRAPVYYDGQLRATWAPAPGHVVDAFFLASDDAFRIVGQDEEGNETGGFGLTTNFQKLRLTHRGPLGEDWRTETSVLAGWDEQAFEFSSSDEDAEESEAYERNFVVALRQEFRRPRGEGEWLGFRGGLDLETGPRSYRYAIAAFGDPEEGNEVLIAPALYAEPSFQLGPVGIVPGVRMDGWSYGEAFDWSVDPRLAMTLDATPTTRLKAAVGRYTQFPTARQTLDVEPDALAPFWSLQTGLGIEQQVGPYLTVEANGYANWLFDLIVGREDAFAFFSGPPDSGPFDTEDYANEGSGRIYGVELLAKLATRRTVALVSATFGRSVRVRRDGTEELFRYDQPYVINALGSHELPRKWRVGARVRLSAGYPYTPVVNKVYDLGSRSFLPIYGETDSGRLPVFWSLDVRIDKTFTFKRWELTAYLDLQNATNNQNPEVMSWSYDYTDEEPITGLPILPAFGLQATF